MSEVRRGSTANAPSADFGRTDGLLFDKVESRMDHSTNPPGSSVIRLDKVPAEQSGRPGSSQLRRADEGGIAPNPGRAMGSRNSAERVKGHSPSRCEHPQSRVARTQDFVKADDPVPVLSVAERHKAALADAPQDFEERINLKRAKESLSFSTNFQNSLQKRLQTKIVELAKHYNEESIEAVTNFFADILSFATLWFLLVRLEIQINITKSFLLEVFFGLDDSKKSLLILFLTDLLVGYHSPNIWELFFQTLFDHYGLPESQTTIFLLVATLPVLLDVLFKYLIFRHLNRASPATVATYHAMIE